MTMRSNIQILILVWLASMISAAGQAGRGAPRIGYFSPSGASRGTTIEIIAGGQNLRSMDAVRISGSGVQGRIIKTYKSIRNPDKDERALMQWTIACRRAEIQSKPMPPKPKAEKPKTEGAAIPEVKLPEHPIFDLLATMDLPTIQHWQTVFRRRDRMQPSPQLGELVRVEIKVAADAELGIREIRFSGPQGLSNPMRFDVGCLKEVFENEPNEDLAESKSPAAVISPPCTLNGQIQSGDIDMFRFHAQRGEEIVVKGQARALIPYLADAVPGWFQMVVIVRDMKGREIAYGDDFRHDPDPLFRCKIPEGGDYLLEVRDSIYRGREDFIYRISIGELPVVTSVFPLGGKLCEPVVARVGGWNLSSDNLPLDVSAGGWPIRRTRCVNGNGASNDVVYAVDSLEEITEKEPNHDTTTSGEIPFPCIINGRIEKPGDVDVFRIHGRKGMECVVEVMARRLRFPLDSIVHVADENGAILAWNDDAMEKDGTLHLRDGLMTHHADSRMRFKIQADGPYFVRIADSQHHGGPEYSYRLKIAELRPDFEICVTPSVVNLSPGSHVPVRIHLLRNDGFDGEVRLLLDNAPPGFKLSGAVIPPGVNQVRVTLASPPNGSSGVFPISLSGTAGDGEKSITRKAVAADDMMQAFLWRHLVPTHEWLASVSPRKGRRPPVNWDSPVPVQVPVSGSSEVKINVPKWIAEQNFELELSEAPPGVRLSPVRDIPGGLAFDVIADAPTAKVGLQTNLIIDVFSNEPNRKGKNAAKPAKQAQRSAMMTLPALPITLISSKTP